MGRQLRVSLPTQLPEQLGSQGLEALSSLGQFETELERLFRGPEAMPLEASSESLLPASRPRGCHQSQFLFATCEIAQWPSGRRCREAEGISPPSIACRHSSDRTQ